MFRQGERSSALALLRAYVATMLDTDNMQGGLVAVLEYANMMAASGQATEAAQAVRHLEATGLFAIGGWRDQLGAAAVEATADAAPGDGSSADATDQRGNLEAIARHLDALLAAERSG